MTTSLQLMTTVLERYTLRLDAFRPTPAFDSLTPACTDGGGGTRGSPTDYGGPGATPGSRCWASRRSRSRGESPTSPTSRRPSTSSARWPTITLPGPKTGRDWWRRTTPGGATTTPGSPPVTGEVPRLCLGTSVETLHANVAADTRSADRPGKKPPVRTASTLPPRGHAASHASDTRTFAPNSLPSASPP